MPGINASDVPSGDGEGEGDWDGDGDGLGDGLSTGVGEALGDGLPDGLGVGLCDDSVCLGEPQAPRPTAMAAKVPISMLRRLNSVMDIPFINKTRIRVNFN